MQPTEGRVAVALTASNKIQLRTRGTALEQITKTSRRKAPYQLQKYCRTLVANATSTGTFRLCLCSLDQHLSLCLFLSAVGQVVGSGCAESKRLCQKLCHRSSRFLFLFPFLAFTGGTTEALVLLPFPAAFPFPLEHPPEAGDEEFVCSMFASNHERSMPSTV